MKHPERSAWLCVSLATAALGFLGGHTATPPVRAASAEVAPAPRHGRGTSLEAPPPGDAGSGAAPRARSAEIGGGGASTAKLGDRDECHCQSELGDQDESEEDSEAEPEAEVEVEPEEALGRYPVPVPSAGRVDMDAEAWLKLTKVLMGPPKAEEAEEEGLSYAWQQIVQSLPEASRKRLGPSLLGQFPSLSFHDVSSILGLDSNYVHELAVSSWRAHRGPSQRERLVESLEYANSDDSKLLRELLQEAPRDLRVARLLSGSDSRGVLAHLRAFKNPSRDAQMLMAELQAESDPLEAARAYMRLCAHDPDPDILSHALALAPKLVEQVLAGRRGDPAWEQASVLARLQHRMNEDDGAGALRVFDAGWRALKAESLVETVEYLGYSDLKPRTLTSAIEKVIRVGTIELALSAIKFAPDDQRWQLYGRIRDDLQHREAAASYMGDLLEERPLWARSQLDAFLTSTRGLSGDSALRLATQLQTLGDPSAAKRLLLAAPSHASRDRALQVLARGEDLEELSWDEE
jgi:hypothetical protein